MTRRLALALCAGTLVSPALAQNIKPLVGSRQDEIILAPVVVCFTPGTDPMYAKRVEAIVAEINRQRFGAMDYQLTGRWSGTAGSPRALTWSFAPDGINIPNGVGEPAAPNNIFASMDAKFAALGGRATWIAQFTSVFARWQALSGLSYTRITVGGNDWDDGAVWGSAGAAGARGDLRISSKNIDNASGVLAYNQFPSNGDMVLDSSENWQSGSPTFRFLRNTIAHEHGHGMGLLHVDPTSGNKLMEPFLNTGFDGPQQDDIRGAQRHYGDPFEDNNTFSVADPAGAINSLPTSITFGTIPAPAVSSAALLSIDADGEIDFWSFTVNAPCSLNATATPVGSTYLQGPQGGATANVNALAQADLAIAVLASNGTTVLGSSATAAIGVAETVTGVSIPAPGTYYVRVTESNTVTQTQLYTITLAASAPPVCPQITQQPAPVTECETFSATFTIAATGSPAPTFQWRRNTVPIPGATLTTYDINSLAPSHAGSYDCVVTNACGSLNSTAVDLVVLTTPVFNTHPANQTVPAGSPASFTVAAVPASGLTLQWRKDTISIPGENGTTYSIASVTPGDAGVYDCVATNQCGSSTSNSATLTVGGPVTCYANCDGSTGTPILTANDFTCFINAYATGDSYANCDGSTTVPVLTANDFTCFVNSFAIGCT